MEVKIEGFWNKQSDGRKVYFKGRTLEWVVDSDKFSLVDLKSDLFEKIGWGSSQTPKIWFLDKTEARELDLLSESQIPDLIVMYRNDRKLSFLIVLCDVDRSSNCSGTNSNNLCTPSQAAARIILGSQSQVNSTQECNVSDNLVDYVGLDYEALYFSSHEDDFAHASAGEKVQIGAEIVSGDKIYEESIVNQDVVGSEPSIAYDPNNPKIELKVLFSNANTFRHALRHFAIKNEFEYIIVKSNKNRFIEKCRNPDCLWRIRASKVQASNAFMVCMHTILEHLFMMYKIARLQLFFCNYR
jgi:MuDR family transposase